MTVALHERIRRDFERRIMAGDLVPGDRLPTEHELIAVYDCSRMTVHKALRALAAEGMIERRRGAGTIVAQPRVHAMVLDIPDLAAMIGARGQRYRFAQRRAEHHDAHPAIDGAVLEIEGVHLADDAPIADEHRVISLTMAPDIPMADLAVEGPGAWLLRHVPWSEAETRITAAAATASDAEALDVAVGAPCLCVDRRTWRGDDVVTSVRHLFPAASYELVARFGPGGRQGPR